MGYNGVVFGCLDCLEGVCLWGWLDYGEVLVFFDYDVFGFFGFCIVIYVEMNVLFFVIWDIVGFMVYVIDKLCFGCCKVLVVVGVVWVVWFDGEFGEDDLVNW